MSDLAGGFSILWPGLVAGILVGLSHVPLGQQVLRRGSVFIGRPSLGARLRIS